MSGSMRYPNQVTVESQTKTAQERLKRYEVQLETIKKVLPIIAKFEGKQITKHLQTALEKAFPEDKFYLDKQYGMYHMNVTPKGFEYKDQIRVMLGHQGSSDFVNMVKVNEHNQCYLLNEERIPKLKAGFAHIKKLVAKRDKAIALFKEMQEEAEQYEMDYDFDVKD